MTIKSNDSRIRYSGRIDWSVETEPVWVFPCTSAELKFTGSVFKLHVRNKRAYWENYLGVIVDGVQQCYYLKEGESTIDIMLPENETGEHHVLVFKRQDSCHEVAILGFEIEDKATLLPLDPAPELKIEVYGDSVSAGEVTEAIDNTGMEDPQHNGGYSNSWYSYSWMTARKLNAQIHDIAQGGIALTDGIGWFMEPQQIGMDSAWDKIHYNPVFGEPMQWDFSQYTPDVVIVAVGQNDAHPYDFMKLEPDGEQAKQWKTHYRAFLERLREVYPDAHIICATTVLEHDSAWDEAIDTVVKEMASENNDSKVSHYTYKRNGCGTPGHPRIPEAYEMADEMAGYIKSVLKLQ
ncbi:GDSL-type esterase/lipase family protein [Agathobacter sp.]